MTNTLQRILVLTGKGMHAPASNMSKSIGTKRKQPREQGHRMVCVVGIDRRFPKSKQGD